MMSETESLYAERPMWFLDGLKNDAFNTQLLSFAAEETLAGRRWCQAMFQNVGSEAEGEAGYAFFDSTQLWFGTEVEIRTGAENGLSLFKGLISALEGVYPADRPPEIQIFAEDRLDGLRRTRRTRAFESLTDGDVIALIASEHNLQVDLQIEGDLPEHAALVQLDQSDLAFIRERAFEAGLVVRLDGNALIVRERGAAGEEPVPLEYGAQLRSISVRADLVDQITNLHLTSWNDQVKAAVSATATSSDIFNDGSAGPAGGDLLTEVFGDRPENIAAHTSLTPEQAEFIARNTFSQRARRFVVGEGLSAGNGHIQVGRPLALSGLGEIFDGVYEVSRVRHTYDQKRGFETAFTAQRAGLRGSAGPKKGRRPKYRKKRDTGLAKTKVH